MLYQILQRSERPVCRFLREVRISPVLRGRLHVGAEKVSGTIDSYLRSAAGAEGALQAKPTHDSVAPRSLS